MGAKGRNKRILRFIGRAVDSSEYRSDFKEQEIASMGPMAIGHYGEQVARRFLASNGVFPKAQYPYKDRGGLLHRADFFDSRTMMAYEVKTGIFRSGSIHEFKVEPLEYAISSGQFNRVIYVNVKFLGRVGFSESIRGRLEKFGTITLC